MNKLAGDVGVPSGADGAIDQKVDQGMQGGSGGNNQGGGADGMINQGTQYSQNRTSRAVMLT